MLTGILVGALVGGTVGVLVMALVNAKARAKKCSECMANRILDKVIRREIDALAVGFKGTEDPLDLRMYDIIVNHEHKHEEET